MKTRRTPKVFNSSYKPPKKVDYSQYKKLWPMLVALIIIVFAYSISNIPYFSIKNIEIVGATDTTASAALDKLKGKSIFSGSIDAAINSIKQEDLLLSDIKCSRGIPSTLRCETGLRSTSLIWQSNNSSFAVDSYGNVFDTVTSIPASTLVVQDRSGNQIKLGTVVATSAIIDSYKSINDQLTKAGFVVSNLYVTDTLYQVGVVTTGNQTLGWSPASPINLLVVTSAPIDEQVSTIVATIQNKKNQIMSSVDVRVSGYVYIK